MSYELPIVERPSPVFMQYLLGKSENGGMCWFSPFLESTLILFQYKLEYKKVVPEYRKRMYRQLSEPMIILFIQHIFVAPTRLDILIKRRDVYRNIPHYFLTIVSAIVIIYVMQMTSSVFLTGWITVKQCNNPLQ